MQAGALFYFGIYRLDPANRQLWRRKHVVKLTHKALQVLHYLVEHAGQLVTKDALFQSAWPATVVTDSALTVCIKELRKALGDDPHAPQYIETVYRRGYRFIAPAQRAPYSPSRCTVHSRSQPIASYSGGPRDCTCPARGVV